MLRFPLVLLVLLCFSSAASAQESDSNPNCDSLCLLPSPPPSDCLCGGVVGGTGSAGINNPDPRAKAIIDEMRENYLDAVESVDNYTVVQTTSVGGPPIVIYYEKEIVNGFPGFRVVNPGELADQEAQSRGEMTSQDIAGDILDFARGLGGDEDSADDPDESGSDESL